MCSGCVLSVTGKATRTSGAPSDHHHFSSSPTLQPSCFLFGSKKRNFNNNSTLFTENTRSYGTHTKDSRRTLVILDLVRSLAHRSRLLAPRIAGRGCATRTRTHQRHQLPLAQRSSATILKLPSPLTSKFQVSLPPPKCRKRNPMLPSP